MTPPERPTVDSTSRCPLRFISTKRNFLPLIQERPRFSESYYQRQSPPHPFCVAADFGWLDRPQMDTSIPRYNLHASVAFLQEHSKARFC